MSDAAPSADRLLLGGVGYSHLRDFSVGPILIRELRGRSWPTHVVVRDLSYNPLAVAQRLQDEEPPFQRLVVVGAKRRERSPGTVVAYRWDGSLPEPDVLQTHVAEAVTGIIDLDALILVPPALGVRVSDVVVVEVEPGVEEPGDTFSPPVRRAANGVRELLVGLATDPSAADALVTTSLGGGGSYAEVSG